MKTKKRINYNNFSLLLERTGYKQKDLFEKGILAPGTAARIRQGNSNISITVLLKICKFFNCSLDDILEIEEIEEIEEENINLKEIKNKKISYRKFRTIFSMPEATKRELFQKIGIGYSTYDKLLTDEPLVLNTFVRICNNLGCELSDLVEIENSEFLGKQYDEKTLEKINLLKLKTTNTLNQETKKRKISYSKLRYFLKRTGLKRKELSELLDVSDVTIISLFKDRGVRLSLLLKICNIFNLRLDDIVELVEFGNGEKINKNNKKVSYNKLWDLLKERKIEKGKLAELSGIGMVGINKLLYEENVTTDVLLKICNILNCGISDIVEFIEFKTEDEDKNNKKVSYKKMWDLLKEKKISNKDFLKLTEIDKLSFYKLGRDENLEIDILLQICNGLNCELDDILEMKEANSFVRGEISYAKLKNYLKENNISNRKFVELTRISESSLNRIKREEEITMGLLLQICNGLNCELDDILEIL